MGPGPPCPPRSGRSLEGGRARVPSLQGPDAQRRYIPPCICPPLYTPWVHHTGPPTGRCTCVRRPFFPAAWKASWEAMVGRARSPIAYQAIDQRRHVSAHFCSLGAEMAEVVPETSRASGNRAARGPARVRAGPCPKHSSRPPERRAERQCTGCPPRPADVSAAGSQPPERRAGRWIGGVWGGLSEPSPRTRQHGTPLGCAQAGGS